MSLSNLPKALHPIVDIANNYWWSWNQESWALFEQINAKVWSEGRNPILTLNKTSSEALDKISKDSKFLEKLERVSQKLTTYLNREKTWFNSRFDQKEPIAYFSAEFGLHEALPIYSGGLGILAGDHVKSSSDLGIPMCFIGLFYKNGYFKQEINQRGEQVDTYEDFEPSMLSIKKVKESDGPDLNFKIQMPNREITIQAFETKVGINTLYLLDSSSPENSKEDQDITSKLYGGDRVTRISQEIILGIGGVKLLKKLKIQPKAWHMNEGHSGFFQLERTKDAMKDYNISFEEARVISSSNCLFTTHTPVPAGNEAFSFSLMHEYFHSYIKELGISWHRFLKLGLIENEDQSKDFSLTIFALNFSRFHNGVSELHGKIAAKMWKKQWPNVSESENPIAHITNGVHVQTWAAQEMKELFHEFMGGDWEDQLANHNYWKKAERIPNNAIRETKLKLKDKMINLVRKQLTTQLKRNGEPENSLSEAQSFLAPEVLTIGFARRFATYKRATLIFKDLQKLDKIVNDKTRPVQFIFAGKAHPADIHGQKFIQEIYEISRRPEFKGKVIILENYDMNISRHMVAGVDVWLNNPRRPMEASGTSGQKVPLNSGLNFSVLDGWWREGYNGKNGWVIGKEKDYPSTEVQDFEDAHDFYRTLNETIAPLYYDQSEDGNISNSWIEKCKESLISNISNYSTHRMVQDYTQKFYRPALAYGNYFLDQDLSKLKDYIKIKKSLTSNWPMVTLNNLELKGPSIEVASDYKDYNQTLPHHVEYDKDYALPGRIYESVETDLEASLYLGDIPSKNIKIELVISDGKNDLSIQEFDHTGHTENGLSFYKTSFKSSDGKARKLRVRYYPFIDGLQAKFELSLCSWF